MGSLLDDPSLLRSLVRQAKSSHSSQGRAMDTTLSHKKHLGGDALAPSAMSTRRRMQQRELQEQRDISAAWEASVAARARAGQYERSSVRADATVAASGSPDSRAHTALSGSQVDPLAGEGAVRDGGGALQVPALATVAPSFTKAAEEGVEAFGGTKIQGPGYTCMIGLVPTSETVQCIDDEFELISSMRPYRYDAKRQHKQAALREASAPPHPDLLRGLEPTLAAVCPTNLLDVDALPRAYLLSVMQQGTDSTRRAAAGAEEQRRDGGDEEAEGEQAGHEGQHTGRSGTRSGTYPFLCKGRPGGPEDGPRLPGQRQPSMGQYNPRYTVVEPRVLGGHIQPADSAANVPRGLLSKTGAEAGDQATSKEQSCASFDAANATQASGTLRAATATLASREGFAATTFSRTYAPHRPGSATVGGGAAGGGDGADEDSGPLHKPGENIKGSSMFLSKTERKMERGTAAPDVVYWPYPDARSTTRRVPCGVRCSVPVHTRRRQPPISGVPSAVYNVGEDIAANPHTVVNMQTSTSRSAHWYGKSNSRGGAAQAGQRRQADIADSSDFANVDAARKATRPAERAVTLPPREEAPVEARLRQHREAQQQSTTVSVEMNLTFPPPLIGGPDKLAKVRNFAHVPGRAQRERAADGPRRGGLDSTSRDDAAIAGPYDDGSHTLDDALAFTEKRPRAVHISARAPGHGAVQGTTTVTELGEVPNLKWVKPSDERTTTFGSTSKRPDHLLPFHDLTYDTERGYKAVEPRVTGDPAIGSVTSREHRNKIFATHGCGPQKVLAYDNVDPPRTVKSVPVFDKQITKETQFVGHRIPSERWERANPKAPGPGYYNVSYKVVE